MQLCSINMLTCSHVSVCSTLNAPCMAAGQRPAMAERREAAPQHVPLAVMVLVHITHACTSRTSRRSLYCAYCLGQAVRRWLAEHSPRGGLGAADG